MADKAPERRTVFISYSHKDEVWKDRLVKHLESLRREGLVKLWDDRAIEAGSDWRAEIQGAIDQARVAVLLVSPDFLSSNLVSKVEVPHLLGQAARRGTSILPVLVRESPLQDEAWLSKSQIWPFEGKPLGSLRGSARDSSLAALARQILDILESESPRASKPLAGPQVSISRISTTAPELFGREAELKTLDDAWESPHIRVLAIVGWSGIGKTTLVNEWLARMARSGYRGAERVFGWSFSGDSTVEGLLAEALRWFGVAIPADLPWEEQVSRLAEAVIASRTLLILDGLEFVQDETGRLRSRALDLLIRKLAQARTGLLILTSRIPPSGQWSAVHLVLELRGLSTEAATALLRSIGVQGTNAEVARVCNELAGHPLSLVLLGASLKETRNGEIPARSEMGALTEDLAEAARQAFSAYETLLSRSELALLRLFGLFDRPATRSELEALCAPPVSGLTTAAGLESEESRSQIVRQLTKLGLLSLEKPEAPTSQIRAHLLIHQYFRRWLRKEHPEAFRLGHERLFRHLASSAGGQPETLEEMAPLFHAVRHGCAAGLWNEALQLFRRISRGETQYLTRRLGAAEAELELLTPFFDQPWSRPRPELDDDDALLILQATGNALLATGRPREAQASFAALVERERSLARWTEATWAARRLAEAQIFTGHLGQALITAQEAVELSERSGEEEVKQAARIILADAHHQAGRLQEARQIAQKADLPSYRYLDLLLALGRFRPVLKQVSNQRMLAERSGDRLRVALSHLALGRAQMEEEGASSRDHFDQAVEMLRRAGFRQWLPASLLARAGLELLRGTRLDEARRDLEEALDIATRCELRLYEADAHLAFTRLYLKTGEPQRARQSLSRARSLVDETGYHRRDGELQELEARLSSEAAASPLDPVTLAFRLVLAGHATPDLLLHPDPGRIEDAARRLSDEPGDPLLRAQRLLEEQQPGVLPNPLWAAWVTLTHGKALQQLGRRGGA